MAQKFTVTANWGDEAKVFTPTADIPGFVVGVDTFVEFVSLVERLAPEMLGANLPHLFVA